MDKIVERYYQVKQTQKELEQELADLRQAILDYCRERETMNLDLDTHVVKLVSQNRREYDEQKLYEVLPDLELWRMLSKPDSAKIASLVKLNVIAEEKIKDTYTLKPVTVLQVDKK
ncbi:hypothetical protein DFP94_103428 [Fontibacillus phaseoli]|uniref:Uncharacterized protein n=1 Tax=Fontibacillus phaseoli TaxID=1416533 RepID=A0A369BHF0_9BACL|nr:hypothetical protein [Fontibacillus phaseoli]RCX20695.1 hypothetical protein DFP94_103428 [Fontibacillus phaseoli]